MAQVHLNVLARALYQRDHLLAQQAPKRKVQRFIADNILPLQ